MTLEEIFNLWEEDAPINVLDLGGELMKISEYHCKYWKIYIREKLLLKNIENEYAKIYKDTYEFYVNGASNIKDIQRAPKGAILKNEAEKYIQADDEIIKISIKLATQREKTDFIKSIIDCLKNRGYNISKNIEYQKFLNGVG